MEAVQSISQYELERGKPMPSENHGAIQASVIGAFLRYRENYSVLSELSLELDDVPYVPDVSLYPRLDLHPLHDVTTRTDPPLLIVEILSPTQSLDDLTKKAKAFLEAGVKCCWIVQMALEAVTVLLPDEKPVFYTSGDIVVPGTEVTASVEEIFRPFH